MWLEANVPDGFDGELVVPEGTFNDCQSAFMSHDGKPVFEYHVFDDWSAEGGHRQRLFSVGDRVVEKPFVFLERVFVVPHYTLYNAEEVESHEKRFVDAGYEGIMFRAIDGPYKQGRSTLKEGYLLKLKRWEDSEAVILEVVERQHNTNEKQVNELGMSKRSTAKGGLVGAGTLGAFRVRDLESDAEFDVGTGEGLTDELRAELWAVRASLPGQIITYKFQLSGVKDKPRFPTLKGFRDEADIGEPDSMVSQRSWF